MQSHEIQKYILNPSSMTAIVEYMSEIKKEKIITKIGRRITKCVIFRKLIFSHRVTFITELETFQKKRHALLKLEQMWLNIQNSP